MDLLGRIVQICVRLTTWPLHTRFFYGGSIPFLSPGLSLAEISRQLSFYELMMSVVRPAPKRAKVGSLLHYVMASVLIWPWHSEVDSRPWTSFNGFKPAPHRHMTCTCDCIYSFNVLLIMGAESTRNMYSNLAVSNKYDCLKLHHVGYLIK